MVRLNDSTHKLKIVLSIENLVKHFGVSIGTGSKVLGRGKCFLMLVFSLATVAVLKRLVPNNFDLIFKSFVYRKWENTY